MKVTNSVIACLVALSLLLTLLSPGFRKIRLWEKIPFVGMEEDDMPKDKSLDGLLPSGLNEESCLSRYQSSLYRKTSPYKPSPYLLSKLRTHEDLHRRCGPGSASYNESLRLLHPGTNASSDSSAPCSYIVLMTRDGLGNRMLAVASAFLYALLTNRVLLIDRGNGLEDLFCEPFPENSWFLPKDFPLRQWFPQSYGNMLRASSARGTLPSYLFLYLSHDSSNYDKLFYCDKYQMPLKNIPWLVMETNNYIVPGLFMANSFEKEMSKLFPRKDAVFHHLGRYLFHPTNDVWGLITRFYDAYLAKAKDKIGIQVRVFKSESATFQNHMDQILSCTRKEKILPEINKNTSTRNPNPNRNRNRKAVLITSLSSMYLENAKNLYWEYPTVNGDVVGIYQPSHEDYQKSGEKMHNRRAWAEIYLLSLTDVLVTSAWSTFGYVAQGLAGVKPWILYKPEDKAFGGLDAGILYKNENQTEHSLACGKAISMEPCFHAPPVCDCKSMGKIDLGLTFPFVRHCEDLSWGVKVVDDGNH